MPVADDLTDAIAAARALAGTDPEILHRGSGCVFRDADRILKVAPPGASLEQAQIQAAAAMTLASVGVTTPEVLDVCLAPPGRVVTILRYVDHTTTRYPPRELGALLARVHQASPERLPVFDPLADARARMEVCSRTATPDEFALITTRLAQADDLGASVPTSSTRFLHGDFASNNVLHTHNGPVVIDFEHAGAGNPCWDLLKVAHRQLRYEAHRNGYTEEFFAGYGDQVDRDLLTGLFPIMDLRAAVWTVAGRAVDPWFVPESLVRLEALRDPAGAPDWHHKPTPHEPHPHGTPSAWSA